MCRGGGEGSRSGRHRNGKDCEVLSLALCTTDPPCCSFRRWARGTSWEALAVASVHRGRLRATAPTTAASPGHSPPFCRSFDGRDSVYPGPSALSRWRARCVATAEAPVVCSSPRRRWQASCCPRHLTRAWSLVSLVWARRRSCKSRRCAATSLPPPPPSQPRSLRLPSRHAQPAPQRAGGAAAAGSQAVAGSAPPSAVAAHCARWGHRRAARMRNGAAKPTRRSPAPTVWCGVGGRG